MCIKSFLGRIVSKKKENIEMENCFQQEEEEEEMKKFCKFLISFSSS